MHACMQSPPHRTYDQPATNVAAYALQGKDVVLMDQLAAATKLALDRQSMFYEDKLAADGLCRTKKEKRKKDLGGIFATEMKLPSHAGSDPCSSSCLLILHTFIAFQGNAIYYFRF